MRRDCLDLLNGEKEEQGQKRILFVCTGNSSRSQMAEALLRHMAGGRYEAHSAGTEPQHEVNPFVIEVLQERGIDTGQLHPKNVRLFMNQRFDTIVTLCDTARETCPALPDAARVVHWSIEDPAAHQESYFDILSKFREVRDELEGRIQRELVQDIG